jgi:sigma-E factor negative regulatory protein RseA
MKERISAFVDGEVDELERVRILREMSQDSTLRRTWERYHLASAAMRRELDMLVNPGLADQIHERLQHEGEGEGAGSRRRFASRRTLKFAAGAAIAASVAAIAILNLPPVLVPATTSSIAKLAPVPGTAPVTVATDVRQALPEQQRALSEYLMHHGEYAPAAGMNGMLTYVRVVGQDNTKSNASAE